MDDWNWDIKLSLMLFGVVAASLVVWAAVPVVKRMIWWHRVKPHRERFSNTWKQNYRVTR